MNKPLRAELGPADISSPILQSPSLNTFNAWCVRKYAKCSVRLSGGILSVDNSSGITSNQLISWSKNDRFRQPSGFIGGHHLYAYNFVYLSSSGRRKEATIVFQNSKYSDKFYLMMKKWNPSKERRCRYNFDTRKEVC